MIRALGRFARPPSPPTRPADKGTGAVRADIAHWRTRGPLPSRPQQNPARPGFRGETSRRRAVRRWSRRNTKDHAEGRSWRREIQERRAVTKRRDAHCASIVTRNVLVGGSLVSQGPALLDDQFAATRGCRREHQHLPVIAADIAGLALRRDGGGRVRLAGARDEGRERRGRPKRNPPSARPRVRPRSAGSPAPAPTCPACAAVILMFTPSGVGAETELLLDTGPTSSPEGFGAHAIKATARPIITAFIATLLIPQL